MRQISRKAPWYRSMLFVPGSNSDWMLKSPKYGADALIFDLEDSVRVEDKSVARERVVDALEKLREGKFGRFVRINGWWTGNAVQDLIAVVRAGVDGIALPKIEDVEDVMALDLVLSDLEIQRGLTVGRIEIFPMCEAPQSICKLFDICRSSERIRRSGNGVTAVPGGDGDRALGLYSSIGKGAEEVVEDRLKLNGQTGLQARAAGVTRLMGGLCSTIDDHDLVRRVAQRAKALGAGGTLVIHPSHVRIVNDVFSPSIDEIAEARANVIAMAQAVKAGAAAVRLNGRMIDYAQVRTSVDLLTEAKSVGIEVGEFPTLDIPSF